MNQHLVWKHWVGGREIVNGFVSASELRVASALRVFKDKVFSKGLIKIPCNFRRMVFPSAHLLLNLSKVEVLELALIL